MKKGYIRSRGTGRHVSSMRKVLSHLRMLVVLIMLSGLPTANLAFAQSGVTLYGIIDTSIEVTNTGQRTTVRMDSGSQIGSEIGLKGREDIGGGYYVEFQLENGFFSQSGAAANPSLAFSRQAWVGMGSPLGTLRFGLQHTPVYNMVACYLDAFCDVSMASSFNNFLTITPRTNNAIRYDSPAINGLKVQAMAALRDATMEPSNGIASYYLAFEYNNNGPLNTEGGYMSTGSPVDSAPTRAIFYGLSYAFGKLRLYGAITHASIGTTLNRNAYGVSARYSATPFDAFMLGYAYLRDTTAAHNNADQFGLEYQHYLSKRTFLYVDGGYLQNRHNATFTLNGATVAGLPADYPGAPIKGIQFGVEHRF